VAPKLPAKPSTPNAGLPAVVVAQVPPGTQGPVIAHFDDRSLAVLVRSAESSWQFESIVIRDAGARVEPAVNLGVAPGNIELLFVKSLPGDVAVLVYTHLENDGAHHLSLQVLDAGGKRRAGPTEIAASSEALQWVDVVPSADGPLIFWATRRGDRADVRAAALGADGVLRAGARDVASDLRAWQVAPFATGAVLASVRALENKTNGPVLLTFLDNVGVPSGQPLALTNSVTAELDVDVMSVGGNAVAAWTDRVNGESRLHAAAANKAGIVTPDYPLTPPLGDQLLTKLIAPRASGNAYIVWQNAQVPSREPRLQIAPINDKAQLGKQRLSVAYPGLTDRMPEIVSTKNGLALLTQISARALSMFAAPHSLGLSSSDLDSQWVPVFAAFSENLTLTGVEPLLSASRPKVPSLAWGLECRDTRCFALGAISSRTDVAVVGIPLSSTDRAGRCLLTGANDVGAPPAKATDVFDNNLRRWLTEDTSATERPRLAAVRVVHSTPPLADLAVSRGSDVPWVAALTYIESESAPDGKRAPQAQIDLRGPLGETSYFAGNSKLKALSAGGIAWAAATEDQDRILAFTALEQNKPQLVVVRFDRSGKRIAQRPITQHSTTLSSLTAAGVKSGYFVGWIDDRGATATAQFVRLTRTLDRRAPEQMISSAPSAKTGLRLLGWHEEVWAVWSDTRDSTTKRGDIFLARYAQSDGRSLAPEQRLFETPAHSHSPQLAAYASGVVAAFVETEPRDAEPAGIASVKVARLDESGRSAGMRQVEVTDGVPSGFGIDCSGNTCRIVVAVDLGGTGQIEVASFDPQASTPIRTTALVRSQGPADESVSPVISGNDVYWVDRGAERNVRVMRAAVEW
jgi:hypothetical protein